MEKPSFFPSPFQPSRPISSFFFSLFSSFPRPRKPSRRPIPFPSPFSSLRPKTPPRAGPLPFPGPTRPPTPSFPPCHRQVGPTCRGLPLPRAPCGLCPESGQARRAADFGRGPHAKALLRPIKGATPCSWNPTEPQPPPNPRKTLMPPPLTSPCSELRVAPSLRRAPVVLEPLRSFAPS